MVTLTDDDASSLCNSQLMTQTMDGAAESRLPGEVTERRLEDLDAVTGPNNEAVANTGR